jgi:hypothetical protein
MKTTDLFKFNRSSKRINESLDKMFGKKLNLESFDTMKLEDARNKLRTQIHTARTTGGFNETLENETLSKAQWMHDAIVAELMDRQEHIVDTTQFEEADSLESEVAQILKKFDEDMNEIGGYGDPDQAKIVELLKQGDWDGATEVVWYAYADQDGGELRDMDNYIEDIEDQFKDLAQGGDEDEGGETDDGYALASAGFGSDEDYESVNNEGGRDPEDWDEGNTEPPNNFAVSINGKQWKVFKGRGQYADDDREKQHYRQLKDWAAKKSESTGKKWEVSITGENPTESTQVEGSDFVKGVKRFIKGKKNPSDVRDAHLAKATFGDKSDNLFVGLRNDCCRRHSLLHHTNRLTKVGAWSWSGFRWNFWKP